MRNTLLAIAGLCIALSSIFAARGGEFNRHPGCDTPASPSAPNIQNLLQPFVQKGRDRTGLGLGLSICQKAVKSMAGELHIRDLPGEGCIFTIDLPRQPPPPTSIHARDGKPKDGHPAGVGKKVRAT